MVGELESERMVVSAPMSFHGSRARIWPGFAARARSASSGWARAAWYVVAVVLIGFAWTGVFCWYLIWGILLIPYRIIRRLQRRRKLDDARHRETLAAIERRDD